MGRSPADRAIVYQLLSDIFAREMSADGLVRLSGFDSLEVTELQLLLQRTAELAVEPTAAARDLAGAFAFLFLGVGGRNAAPPYESVYRDARGLTGRAPTVAMERWLAALDMHVLEAFPEPADHVAIELAVAARLANDRAPEAQLAAFLKERLANWLPDFAAACARGDRTGFYAAASKAAAEFVSTDLDRCEPGQTASAEEDEDA